MRIIENYDFSGELGLIQIFLKKQNFVEVSKTINSILEKEHIHLNHPFNSKVKTTCRSNLRVRMANVLFFSDDQGGNRWCVIQITNLIDGILVENECYQFLKWSPKSNISNVSRDLIETIDTNAFYSKRCLFGGLLVSQKTPYHYFYDQLINIPPFEDTIRKKNKNIVTDKDCFFPPTFKNNYNKSPGNKYYYIFPNTITGARQTNSNRVNFYLNAKKMEDRIKHLSIENKKDKTPDLSCFDLVLWIGITGQKRSWLEQSIGYQKIINSLDPFYKKILILFDGMTALNNKEEIHKTEEDIVNNIKKNINPEIEAISLIGKDYQTKVSYCNKIDIFIANAGTGSMVPLRFCKKPGVLHSNSSLFTFRYDYGELVRRVDSKFVQDQLPNDTKISVDRISYHIHWKHIYNELVLLLNTIKKGTLPYKNIKDSNKKITSSEFESLKKRLSNSSDSADILRETAILFEKSGDYKTALSIMSQAKLLRPTGPVICKKLEEYKQKTNSF